MLKELAIHALYECVTHDGVCPFVELLAVAAETAGIAERVGWMSTAAFHQLCFCPTFGCRHVSNVCSAMPIAVSLFVGCLLPDSINICGLCFVLEDDLFCACFLRF